MSCLRDRIKSYHKCSLLHQVISYCFTVNKHIYICHLKDSVQMKHPLRDSRMLHSACLLLKFCATNTSGLHSGSVFWPLDRLYCERVMWYDEMPVLHSHHMVYSYMVLCNHPTETAIGTHSLFNNSIKHIGFCDVMKFGTQKILVSFLPRHWFVSMFITMWGLFTFCVCQCITSVLHWMQHNAKTYDFLVYIMKFPEVHRLCSIRCKEDLWMINLEKCRKKCG
jgi:hypothetical protein